MLSICEGRKKSDLFITSEGLDGHLLMRDKSPTLIIISSSGKPRKFVFPGSPIHLARRDNSLRLRQFRALRGGRVKIFHCCLNTSFAA